MENMAAFFAILVFVFPVLLYIIFLIAVADLAKRYGRNVTGYVILGLFFSPITAFVLLLCRGEEESTKAERFEDEWKFIYNVLTQCEQERKLKTKINQQQI